MFKLRPYQKTAGVAVDSCVPWQSKKTLAEGVKRQPGAEPAFLTTVTPIGVTGPVAVARGNGLHISPADSL